MVDKIPQRGHGGSVDLNIDGKIAVVTLRRGDNRLNFEMFDAYNKVLDEVERNPEVAVLVTTSEGKFFSNGLDLDYMNAVSQIDPERIRRTFMVELYTLMSRILTFPVPTIAAINGHAFAGGAFISLVHDYRIMQTGRGWWCLNEIFINRRFPPFFHTLIKTKLTPSQITETAVLGSRLTAEKAKSMGIVEEVAPPGKLMEITRKFASVFLSTAYKRDSLYNMKSDMYADVVSLRRDTSNTIASIMYSKM